MSRASSLSASSRVAFAHPRRRGLASSNGSSGTYLPGEGREKMASVVFKDASRIYPGTTTP
ncbi:MAG: hypothetical protein ACKO20_05305, partial [Actinomycetota bacterium]